MALDIDGYAVLGAVATVPEIFPDIRAEIAKTARGLVTKQLKAKNLPLTRLRLIRKALGTETFSLIVDGLSDLEAKGLVTRLDKHHPDLRTASGDWYRQRLGALADDEEPAEKPKGGKPAASRTEPERALGQRPFAASWDGKDHDRSASKGKKKKG